MNAEVFSSNFYSPFATQTKMIPQYITITKVIISGISGIDAYDSCVTTIS